MPAVDRRAPRLARRLGRLAIGIALAAAASACVTADCRRLPDRPSHHVVGGFCNPPGSPEREAGWAEAWADRIRLLTARHAGPVPAQFFVSPEQAVADIRNPPAGDTVSWLGHATVLLRLGGRTILVDPIWSEYATSIPPFGPRRVSPPPVPIEALPPLDMLLITHDHHDHLDLAALRRLPGKERIEAVVPLGLGPFLRAAGFAHVRELDWWQRVEMGALTVWLLPAQHRSGRGLFDENKTLWASYALIDGVGGSRVYLSGDTGYRGHFRDIGKRLGPFDLAVMNVGGYDPLRVANAFHVTPLEAAGAVRELRARRAFAMHWGAYPLGTEPVFAPGPLFAEATRQAGLPAGTVRRLRIGETWAFRGDKKARPDARTRPQSPFAPRSF